MIPKEKIEEAAKKYKWGNLDSETLPHVAFKKGVEFAQQELKDIIIEFADWLNRNCFRKYNGWIYSYQEISSNPYTLNELFKQFLKEKEEKK